MRRADNVVTGNRRGRRAAVALVIFLFLSAIEALALWSFYSYSVTVGSGKPLILRLCLWITTIPTAGLVGGGGGYILRYYLTLCLPLTALTLLLIVVNSHRHGNYRDIEAGSAHWAHRAERKLFSERSNNQPLAEGIYMTAEADLPNGNVIVVANPGDGKSFRVLTPGIIQACRDGHDKPSMIITDTKGALYRDTAKMVKAAGIHVRCLNLTDPRYSCLYNPLCNLHPARLNTELSSLARCFITNTRDVETNAGDAFWEDALYFLLVSVWGYQATCAVNPLTGAEETQAMYRTLELIRGLRLGANNRFAEGCEYAGIVEALRTVSPLHLAVTSYDSLCAAAPDANCQGLFNQVYKKVTFCGLHHEAYA